MGTLAKVAIGVAVAKGVGGMMKGASGAQTRGRAGNGGLFGGEHSPGASGGQSTGLEDLMGSVLGGKQGGGASSGGLGGILEQLSGSQGGGSGGGLGDLLGGLAKSAGAGGGGAAGGLGGLLGGLVSGASQQGGGGSFGDLLNQSLERRGEPEIQPSADQEAAAGLMLSAMIQAAKADGKVDEGERQKLLENLGDVSAEERAFVQNELQQPVDVNRLVSNVPSGMEQQVYVMSVMGIDLDNQKEAQYLHELASAMNIGKAQVNAIHEHLGVPQLYT